MKKFMCVFALLLISLLYMPETLSVRAEEDVAEVDIEVESADTDILKDEEWARIKRMDRAARLSRPFLEPPYPEPTALALMLEQTQTPYGVGFTRLVQVTNSDELNGALAAAQPGDFIYLADGVYVGSFEAAVSGTAEQPIILYGTRNAIIEGETVESDYGLYLTADHWILAGFAIRNVSKGVVTDNANHNLLQGLEVYQIGNEGVHFRSFSSDNTLQYSWIHDTGLTDAEFGEAVYIGSAVTNWERYTEGQPDTSDRNVVINNLLGPNITAEAVDIKEGTTGGLVRNNSFITTGNVIADSWVDVKGNDYQVVGNIGMAEVDSTVVNAVDIVEIIPGWGQNNILEGNGLYTAEANIAIPFRMRDDQDPSRGVTLVMRERTMPYTLSELIARFPGSFEQMTPHTFLLKEHVVAARGAILYMTTLDAHTLRLLSTPQEFIGIATFRTDFGIHGTEEQRFEFVSWDLTQNAPDTVIEDGRAYVFASGGRMDVDYGAFLDLGYTEGTMSGAAWQGYNQDEILEPSRGNVTNTLFMRNYFGAYTYEAVEMQWIGNTWADNIIYGFDPHDFSNDFLLERNVAYGNGSHGIIFSRGCHRNIIRDNDAYNNAGNGIMLDDGKVIPGTDIVRYQLPVPSNDNIVENNRLRDNNDGIVLEGGERNIIRNNEITGTHRFGMRFRYDATETVVENNLIEGATSYGIFIYDSSDANHFTNNTISSSERGIVIRDSTANVFNTNSITGITANAIALSGDVSNSVFQNNILEGQGTEVVNLSDTEGVDLETILEANDLSGWSAPMPSVNSFTGIVQLAVWLAIFLIPLFMRPTMQLRKRMFLSRAVEKR